MRLRLPLPGPALTKDEAKIETLVEEYEMKKKQHKMQCPKCSGRGTSGWGWNCGPCPKCMGKGYIFAPIFREK